MFKFVLCGVCIGLFVMYKYESKGGDKEKEGEKKTYLQEEGTSLCLLNDIFNLAHYHGHCFVLP